MTDQEIFDKVARSGKKSKPVSLFKYNKVTGYWKHERSFDNPENAPEYLKAYKKDAPNEHFHIGSRKPTHNPSSQIL